MKYLTLIAVALISNGGVVADELDILANSEALSDDIMTQSRGGQYELNIDNIHASSDMYGDVAGNGGLTIIRQVIILLTQGHLVMHLVY